MVTPIGRRVYDNGTFVNVMPLHAVLHEWTAGQESSGPVGGACVLWLVIEGQVGVESLRGTWNMEAGNAFMFVFSGERRVYTTKGAKWLSIGLRARAYDTLDLAESLPLPTVWRPRTGDWELLRSNCESLAHLWGAPHFSPVDARTYSLYLANQRMARLEIDAVTALLFAGLASAIFAVCWRTLSERSLESVLGQRSTPWMAVALAKMRENPGIGVEELARAVGLSRRQLGRDFQSHFGASPREFLNRRRLQEARQLLETSNLSLSEIARQTGFAGSSHFKRLFKAAYEVPPEAYRRQSHLENSSI